MVAVSEIRNFVRRISILSRESTVIRLVRLDIQASVSEWIFLRTLTNSHQDTQKLDFATMVKCSACGAEEATSKCSNCLSVSYCDRKCQLNHWENHKKQCSALAKKQQQAASSASSTSMQDSGSPVAATTVDTNNRVRADDNTFSNPGKMCIARIHTDLKALAKDPLDGIFVEQDETRVNVCHAILLGPSDTPYEFGFFYFLLECPDQYPCVPPRVTLKTTGGGSVRFNPNLYSNGKVCLSILGTWNGPAWSPAQNIGSVLLSIRSLLNSSPYYNEPGYDTRPPQESKAYNHLVRHETIRIAVLDMVEHCSQYLPERLASVVESSFFDFCELYKYICEEYSFLDGQTYRDPLSPNRGMFRFNKLKARLEQLQEQVQLKSEGEEVNGVAPSATLTTEGSSSTNG